MHASAKSFFKSIYPVSNDILDHYLSHWSLCQVGGKTIMTAPGEKEKYWNFVLDGIQKSYYLKGQKEHVIAFTYAPSLTGIPDSLLTQKPSEYYLETITSSRFLRIPYSTHIALMKEYRPIETLFRIATEQFLVGMLHRYYELMALTIEERYLSFARRSPHLLTMVTQKDLASYLRIDPTNFSKLINSVRIT